MPKRPPKWLPDWRNVSQYPSPSTTSHRRWAWEFLRRNKKYQEMYNELVRPFLREDGSMDERKAFRNLARLHMRGEMQPTAPKDTEGSTTLLGVQDVFTQEFGVVSLIPPEQSSPAPFFTCNTSRIIPGGNDAYELHTLTLTVFRNEAYAKFHLDMPIALQLQNIKNRLTALQPHKVPKRRYISRSYPILLRLLDGKEAGAQTHELSAHLFSKVKTGPYQNGTQRVYDGLRKAQELRDVGYRYIAWGPTSKK